MPDARFVILGEGELRDALTREIRELGLERHVLLPGFRPDVLSLLKTFDVFVMPSVTEGLGTSLLDAMACARPIVASRVGGIPEVVVDGETGLLVPPKDPDSLAEAIVRLLEDRALAARLADGGLARVRERFTVERMVDRTLEVYGADACRAGSAIGPSRGTAQRASRSTCRRSRTALSRAAASSAAARPAPALERAGAVALRLAEAARVHHPEVAEREIVAHGIDRDRARAATR